MPNPPVQIIVEGQAPKILRDRMEPISYKEFTDKPPLEWIIKKILAHAELAVIYGEPGCGKSFLAQEIALAVALGLAEFHGHKINAGRVVYVCAEGANGFRQRLKAYAQYHGLEEGAFANFSIVPVSPNFLDDGDPKALADHIGEADLIIMDTFARITAGADENSGKDMGAAIQRCQSLHIATGALVILVHHSGKNKENGSRGWSGIKGACDTEIEVTNLGGTRKARISKQKDGQDGIEWHFSLIPYELGKDDDGDPITSCYYDPIDAPRESEIRQKRKLGGWQEAVMNTFEDTMNGESNSFILEEVLIDLTVQNSATPGKNERDTRKQKIRNALTTLYVRKLLQIKDGKVFKY